MDINQIETPALIIDYDVFKNNSDIMMSAINNSYAKLRPHFKSHKCSEIAKFQLKNGAIGVTCAKLSEVETLINAGVKCSILIANQIVQKSKLERLAKLSLHNDVIICVDNKENVLALEDALKTQGSKIGVLIEYEIGMKRCGVLTEEDFYDLYKVITTCPHLNFKGIQAYAGHNSHEVDKDKRLKIVEENNIKLTSLLNYLKKREVKIEIISGASTGTADTKMNQGIYSEIQAGSYLLLDNCYNIMGLKFANSLFVLTTIVSKKDNLVVVDAGVKTVGIDQGLPDVNDFCYSEIVASEEHFQIHNPSKTFNIVDTIKLIPGHCCSTMNLHDYVYLVSGDKVIDKLLIDGRGFGK